MKLRNKKTGEILDDVKYIDTSLTTIEIHYLDNGVLRIKTEKDYHSFLQNWEDYTPKEPLIKDEKIRKAIRAWAEANNFSVFRVHNQHFNYVKIHGVKDRYDPNGSNIEFMGTIAGVDKRTYEIDELCGEEKE